MVTAWLVRVNKQDFGEWLKGEIYNRGWGPSDFAKLVGVGHGSVGNWINRGGVPFPKTCYAIARALGISPEEVLRRAGHTPPPVFDLGPHLGEVPHGLIEDLDMLATSIVPASEQPRTVYDKAVGVRFIPEVELVAHAGVRLWQTVEMVPVAASFAEGADLVSVRVDGDCMEPELEHGDQLIVDRGNRRPAAGDLVTVSTEDGDCLVKRYQEDDGGGLLTDNKGARFRPNGARIEGVVVGFFRRTRRK